MASEIMVRLSADIRDFQREMGKATKDLRELGQNMQSVGQTVGTAFGAMGVAVGAGLGIAVKKAADFEYALSSIKSVAPELASRMDEVKALALEMGAKTKYSALEAAQGMEELIKAGVSVDDIFSGALEGALNLATAGELEVAEAAEIASIALNAFSDDGLSVAQAADILAGAANASATDVGELKYGLSAVSAVAASMGMNFEDTATALAVFAQKGLKGSDAGTSLKTMLMNLQPTTDAQIELFNRLGLVTEQGTSAFYDQEGKMKSLSEIAELLHTSMGDMTDAQRALAMETLFGSDAIRGANILFEAGADGVNKMNEAMGKTTAADVAKTRMDNLKGAMEQLSGAFETAQISIGDALVPALKKVTGYLQKAMDWFNKLPESMKSTIAIGAVVTTMLLLLVSAVGFLVMGLGALVAVEWAVVAPILIIIAVVAVLIAAFVFAYTKFQWFRDGVNNVFTVVKTVVMNALTAVVGFVKSKLEQITQWWNENGQMILQAVRNVWNFISPIIQAAMTIVLMVIVGTWNAIKNVISGALNVIMGIIQFFAALFTGNWGEMWEAIKRILSGAIELAWGLFQLGFGKIIGFFGGWIGKFLGKAGSFLGDLLGKFTSLFPKLGSLVMKGLNAIKNFFDDMALRVAERIASWNGKMGELFLNVVTKIQSIMSGVLNIITSPFKSAWDIVSGIVTKLKNAFNFSWKLPDLKMPHVSVTMKKNSVGIPYPDFNVKWYKRGGMFNGASMIGIGEQPGVKEAAMPLSGKHMQPFAKAVAKWMPQGSGGGAPITIEKMYVRNDNDIKEIARELKRLSDSKKRS